MNRSEFMVQLEKLLSDISENEREEALQYYNDYFNDAGEENEQDVIKALGMPEQVAEKVKEGLGDTKLKGEFTEQGYTSDTASSKKNEITKVETGETGDENAFNNSQDTSDAQKKPKKSLPTWAVVLIIVGSLILASIIITVIMAIRAVKIAKQVAIIGGEKVEEIIDETRPYIEEYIEDAKNNFPENIAEYIVPSDDNSHHDDTHHSGIMEFDASEINKLDVEFGAGSLTVKQKEEQDNTIEVIIENSFSNVNGSIKDNNTLVLSMNENKTNAKIKGGANGFKNNVQILIPNGFIYEKATFELGACDASISGINANDLSVSIGAGNLTMDAIKASDLSLEVGAGKATTYIFVDNADIEVGMGTLDCYGSILGNADIDCGMGAANFHIGENITDHNYKVDCALGSVVIGEESLKSVEKKYIDNNASSEYDIDCGVGAVNIQFVKE